MCRYNSWFFISDRLSTPETCPDIDAAPLKNWLLQLLIGGLKRSKTSFIALTIAAKVHFCSLYSPTKYSWISKSLLTDLRHKDIFSICLTSAVSSAIIPKTMILEHYWQLSEEWNLPLGPKFHSELHEKFMMFFFVAMSRGRERHRIAF